MWKYRDWVIDAFNRDLPFDQFTIEQIAGDMLPNATVDQKIASGFHRNAMTNEEGGVDPDESLYEVLIDRTNTTATVWLGTTLGCAQCHNHKYDPFTQKDYYRLLAFFANTEYESRTFGDVGRRSVSRIALIAHDPALRSGRPSVAPSSSAESNAYAESSTLMVLKRTSCRRSCAAPSGAMSTWIPVTRKCP